MRLSTVDKLVDLASRVLYVAIAKRTSLDRAFQEVVKGAWRRDYDRVPHTLLYRLCRSVARDYIAIEHYLREFKGRRRVSVRSVVKAWIALKGEELFSDDVVRKYRKKLGIDVKGFEEVVDLARDGIEKLVIKYSYPRWFVEELVKHLGISECEQLLAALNDEILWIRVNMLKSDVDRVARILEERGMVIEVDKELPYMIRVLKYDSHNQYVDLVDRCEIVLQDKASAIVVEELGVEPGDTVLDLAAAPGVKTSLIMQLTGNRARVVAVDISRERIYRMRRFLKCMGVDMDRIDLVLADSTKSMIRGSRHKALVDAPCSGSGTIPRDPAIKLHLVDARWIDELHMIQRGMIGVATSIASEVVYAVCSVLPSEGEGVVSRYLENLVKPKFRGAPGLMGLGNVVSRFYPHIHGTHGFFIAKLVPKA